MMTTEVFYIQVITFPVLAAALSPFSVEHNT